jgi:hypothetical protein
MLMKNFIILYIPFYPALVLFQQTNCIDWLSFWNGMFNAQATWFIIVIHDMMFINRSMFWISMSLLLFHWYTLYPSIMLLVIFLCLNRNIRVKFVRLFRKVTSKHKRRQITIVDQVNLSVTLDRSHGKE